MAAERKGSAERIIGKLEEARGSDNRQAPAVNAVSVPFAGSKHSWSTRGRRVTIPEPRGKKSLHNRQCVSLSPSTIDTALVGRLLCQGLLYSLPDKIFEDTALACALPAYNRNLQPPTHDQGDSSECGGGECGDRRAGRSSTQRRADEDCKRTDVWLSTTSEQIKFSLSLSGLDSHRCYNASLEPGS